MSQSREMLSSRLGFLLLSAGCAIGLGNVWRFPYITGAYGGAVFVGVYLLCLLAVLPVMIMEFAVGRASRSNMGRAAPSASGTSGVSPTSPARMVAPSSWVSICSACSLWCLP